MRYIKVEWFHENPADPYQILSEIDEDGWESRRIESFRDGRRGFADESENIGGSFLADKPWPSMDVLRAESEFKVHEIDAAMFDEIWQSRGFRSS